MGASGVSIVEISLTAQAKLLKSQGQSLAQIALSTGLDAATLKLLLG
jgi:hypothetical protein